MQLLLQLRFVWQFDPLLGHGDAVFVHLQQFHLFAAGFGPQVEADGRSLARLQSPDQALNAVKRRCTYRRNQCRHGCNAVPVSPQGQVSYVRMASSYPTTVTQARRSDARGGGASALP